jgi:hypothetical protein
MAALVSERLESRTLFSAAVVMAPEGLTPQQVRHAYQFDQVTFSSRNKVIPGDGRGQTIAIVTAFHDPSIAADLRVFDKTFGLPNRAPGGGAVLQIAHPQGMPPLNGSWAQETALDVEWAHAIAPGARLLLVEAKSEDPGDLFAAVDFARRRPTVSVVSMSWGWDTAPAGVDYTSILTTPSSRTARGNGVTFVEAAADDGVVAGFPDLSVNVVSVGGTTLALDSSGQYAGETPLPQSASPARVAYDAAASPGFAVYDSIAFQGVQGWQTGDGTSAGAPQWAALFAIANQGRAINHRHSLDGATQVRPALQSLPSSDFHVVTGGGATVGRGSPFSDRLIRDFVALA